MQISSLSAFLPLLRVRNNTSRRKFNSVFLNLVLAWKLWIVQWRFLGKPWMAAELSVGWFEEEAEQLTSHSLQHLGEKKEGQTNRDLSLTSASTLASYAFSNSEPNMETPMWKKQMLSGCNPGALLWNKYVWWQISLKHWVGSYFWCSNCILLFLGQKRNHSKATPISLNCTAISNVSPWSFKPLSDVF